MKYAHFKTIYKESLNVCMGTDTNSMSNTARRWSEEEIRATVCVRGERKGVMVYV